ncbi:MAG: molybdate ABC transporter substrate-binding protein [Actinomycetota bacterium]
MTRRWTGPNHSPLIPVLAALLVLGATACAGSTPTGGAGGTGGSAVHDRDLTVSAAASLTSPFTEIGKSFEQRNRGVKVSFSFGPSDGMATQINEGAPVDVFASASAKWMDAVQLEGPGVTGRADFARNKLAVIVPAENPAGIGKLEDLSRNRVKLVLAADGVPAGDYAREIFANGGIADAAQANVVSNEEDVKAVVTKVLSGDADAGIAYVTDVAPNLADRITVITIPDHVNVIATYPIAVVAGSQEADLAQRFVQYVLGEGQAILAEYGFLPVA